MIEEVSEPTGAGRTADPLRDRLRLFLDVAADGITVQDHTGRVIYANDAAARLVGFPDGPSLMATEPAAIFARFEMADESGEPFDLATLPGRVALAGGDPAPRTIRFRVLATGEERWSVVRATPVRDEHGAVVFAVNAFQDITARVLAEREVAASERRYRRLVEALPVAAWTTDPHGRLTVVNARWSEYTGRLPHATLGSEARDIVHPDDLPALAVEWRRAVDGDAAFAGRARFRRHDGVFRWHDVRAVPLRDEAGALEGWVGTATDVDDTVRAASRSRLLAHVGGLLDESLDVESTLEAAGEVVRTGFADWSFIEVAATRGAEPEGDRRVRVEVADVRDRDVAGAFAGHARRRDADGTATGAGVPDATALERPAVVALDGRPVPGLAPDPTSVAFVRRLGGRSAVVAPLVGRGRTIGTVALVRGRSGRSFDDEDAATAEELVRRIALALDNARAYEAEGRARREAEESAERMRRLQRLTRSLADARTRADVARIVLRHARAALDAAGGILYASTEDGTELEVVGAARPRDAATAGATGARATDEERDRIPLSGDLPIVHAVSTTEDVWLGSSAALVLTAKGRTVGGLTFELDGRAPFTPEERDLARAMADLAGQALERVSLAESREHLLADLEAQGARLSAVIDQMPGGVVIAEAPTGRVVLANAQVGRIWRLSALAPAASVAEYEAGTGFRADGTPLGSADWPLARALEGEVVENEEIDVLRGDGTRGTILASAAPIRDPGGAIVAAVVTFADVTEQRAARDRERYLAEAGRILSSSLDHEATIRAVADLAVPGIADWCVIDLAKPDGGIEALAIAHADPSRVDAARMLREHYPPDPDSAAGAPAVIRSGRSQLVTEIPPEAIEGRALADEHRDLIRRLELRSYMCVPLVVGGRTIGAMTFVGAESGRRFVEADLAFAESLASRAASAIENARLYRDRVEAEARLARLAASEHARAAELDAVIRAMGEGIVVCAADGTVTLANPAAERTWPTPSVKRYDDLVAALDDPTGVAPRLGERAGPVELRVAGREERWLELSTYPVAGPPDDGRRPETIVVVRDVSEARQRQAVRDTFVGVLSHELRTPVTTIYGGSKILARGGLDELRRAAIFDDISIEAERLHRLVEDVIALTRFGEAEGDVGQEPVLLQRVVPATVRAEEPRWPGVAFDVDVPVGLPTVVADPTYVEQVVRNLLSNAAKYGGPGTLVEVRLHATPDEVAVRILDDGPGIAAEEAERLFDLYYRSPSTASVAAGAGIGLFVCARLVRAMGGRIWATPREGRGAEFGFTLQVMAAADD